MAKISDVEVPTLLFDEQGSDPATPGSTLWRLYFKSTGLFAKDDGGTVTGPFAVGSQTMYGVTVTMGATSVAQSGVALTFDAEVRDDGAMWASSPNPTRITIQSDGWYTGTGFVTHAADNDGGRRVFWRLGGSTTVGRSSVPSATAMNDATVSATFIEYLTTSQYVELVADQNAGGNLSLTARASVVKIPF